MNASAALTIARRLQYPTLTAVVLTLAGAVSTASASDRLDASRLKNGTAVRAAFRDVVASSRRSTVQIRTKDNTRVLGTIVDTGGHILTKASELTGPISCRLFDGRELDAEIVGMHRGLDLALLRVDATELQPIEWRTVSEWRTGQWLATPGLEELPVAVGVLSVPPQAVPPLKGVLGISIGEADGRTRVTRVSPNSGAHNAGIEVGDVILSIGGKAVKSRGVLENYLAECAPGDSLVLRVSRGDRELDLAATLHEPFSNLVERSHIQNRLGGRLSRRRGGFAMALQHDSVVQPDECGGPLVDLSGKAVGINIARAGRTETFAIPAAVLLPVLDELKSGRLAVDRPDGNPVQPPKQQTPPADRQAAQKDVTG